MSERELDGANAEATADLADLVATLSDADLAADVGDGWTVAMALAHLAYWDSFHAARWRHAAENGLDRPPFASNDVTSRSNEALEATWRALPVAAVPALCLEAAAAIDTVVASLSDAQVAAAIADGSESLVNRVPHRRDHIDQVSRVLGRA